MTTDSSHESKINLALCDTWGAAAKSLDIKIAQVRQNRPFPRLYSRGSLGLRGCRDRMAGRIK